MRNSLSTAKFDFEGCRKGVVNDEQKVKEVGCV